MQHFDRTGSVMQVVVQKQWWLKTWLGAGLLWWLVGMLLLPTSKLYQQGVILLFWVPGVLALLSDARVIRAWLQPMSAVLMVFGAWSALSFTWAGVPVAPKELKIFLYVLLAANALMALACIAPALLWRLLALSALLVGMLAWASLVMFYGVEGRGFSERAVGTALVNHPILGAQLFGVMGILLLYLRRHLPHPLQGGLWFVALLGYAAILVLSQSKGPWVAALLVLLISPLWSGQRWQWLLSLVCIVAAASLLWAFPELVLQRGFSYRPELMAQALLKIESSPWLGLGFGTPYLLPVEALHRSYEHAHNIYLHIAVVLGLPGLFAWLLLHGLALIKAWRARDTELGRMLCTLLCFAMLALFTDGVGPWVKPREEWFCLWLPLFLCMAWVALQRQDSGRQRG
ncbi:MULTISPECIES: O-antigen ligase [unclassified Pseudomonas]|uniref:O-antigen ligase family protein n=1 Tax=unclassified Pseudomonas TaxID=196821 RepID=UPI001268D5F0|nr:MULTISPECIES: O-antigen ligase family protein [unclassified Pseudomonas]